MSEPRGRAIVVGLATAAMALVVGACAPSAPRPIASTSAGDAAAPSGPPASASASAEPDHHAAAIAAFVERVTAGDLGYHLRYTGQVAASADVLPIKGAMDVAGGDFASSWTYDFDPEYPGVGKKKVQVRGVGERGWIKRAGGAWKAIKGYGVEDSYVPFKGVKGIDDVTYLGSVEVDGKTRHRISIPKSLLIHPGTIPYQVKKEKVDRSTLEVLIDDQGLPRTGTWHLVGQARVGSGIGQLQRIVYDLDLTFSKVGDRITIKKP
jgi:hypothetical protein